MEPVEICDKGLRKHFVIPKGTKAIRVAVTDDYIKGAVRFILCSECCVIYLEGKVEQILDGFRRWLEDEAQICYHGYLWAEVK